MLRIRNLDVGYGNVPVLRRVSRRLKEIPQCTMRRKAPLRRRLATAVRTYPDCGYRPLGINAYRPGAYQ